MASNPLADLLDQAGAAQGQLEHSLQAAQLASVDDDGRTGTAQALDSSWTIAARLWQPRLTETMPHSHEIPEHSTNSALMMPDKHNHKAPAQETEEHDPHTHQVEYRVGDKGILLRLQNGIAVFLGGL